MTTPTPDPSVAPPNTVSFAGHAWLIRPATAPEHQRYEDLLKDSGLHDAVMEQSAALAHPSKPVSMRETVLQQELQALAEEIGKRRGKKSAKDRAALLKLAEEFDTLDKELLAVRIEREKESLENSERILRLNDTVYAQFLHEILVREGREARSLEDFTASLTDADHEAIEDIITKMGVRNPLSAVRRKVVSGPGSSSRSRRTPPESPN